MTPVQLSRPSFTAPIRLADMSDAGLAQRLADGDSWALDAIYRRHAPGLCRYARRYVEAGLAEDAVHDALARTQLALLGRGRVVELRPWLFRCVRNACLSELDRAATRRSAEMPAEPVAAGGADSCDVVARNEQLHSALSRMAELPPRQREALALRALDGRGYDELAEHFTLTENAAVQLVHRARRNLVALVA
ncbi:MAG TPA: RNA polymerase sigma factor [Baekduia sp.]|nr:RNA polymerase sigma factor [Baekduia sp.]